ncbi:MAG TPA: TIGR00341 family protein [Thiomicrorhabdus sp.]|nr:TIGR00341 family protein [Thiomicrorhabdus sp.]
MTQYTVLYDSAQTELFEREVQPLLQAYSCQFMAYAGQDSLGILSHERVVLWLGDEALYDVLSVAVQNRWQIGFLPHPDMVKARRSFVISKKMKEAIEHVFSVEEPIESDLLYCNDQLVLSSVMLGSPDAMIPATRLDEGFWSKLKHLMIMTSRLSKMRLQAYQIETLKQHTVRTAALGITIVYRIENSDFTRCLVKKEREDISSLNGLVLAPRSIVDIVSFLFNRFFSRESLSGSLPNYLGHIQTREMTISGNGSLDYSVDGQALSAETIQVCVRDNALLVLNSSLPKKKHSQELKEVVRVSSLPKGQAVKELVNRPLPWVHHSDLEEVKETFVTLSENAQCTQAYLVLMVLSTLLATVGLFANSAPVIIGAMILAPLMAPIVSLSMGVLRQNREFALTSLKTLVTGIGLAILFGTLLSLLVPLHTINSEIGARLSPTLLDLGVAIISGIAAAYASARSEIAKSLAGVAIAVALVPPLAVSGIGLGWLDWGVFSGAFLLFITNLAGIVLAAAATFFVMGFSSFHVAKKGMMVSLLFVAMVSIPLVLSYNKMVKEQGVVYVLEGWKVDGIEVRNVKVRNGEVLYISAKLISNRPLEADQIDRVKHKMEALLGKPIQLEAVSAIVR